MCCFNIEFKIIIYHFNAIINITIIKSIINNNVNMIVMYHLCLKVTCMVARRRRNGVNDYELSGSSQCTLAHWGSSVSYSQPGPWNRLNMVTNR